MLPIGSAPTMMQSGLCSFMRLATPVIVPPVPAPIDDHVDLAVEVVDDLLPVPW
jgi:hypothetical protein